MARRDRPRCPTPGRVSSPTLRAGDAPGRSARKEFGHDLPGRECGPDPGVQKGARLRIAPQPRIQVRGAQCACGAAGLLCLALTPMSAFAIALVHGTATLHPEFGAQLAAIVVTAVLILELIGPVAVQFALRRAGETGETAT